jgi:uncharacterized membrane protein
VKYLQAGFALVSVFVSWTLVHTVFTLKDARLYYTGQPGGIDFNETAAPDYRDFAYLSFTIGTTFQVSDTDIQTKQIRPTALRHAWLSFPLGAVIIATSINLVAGLAGSYVTVPRRSAHAIQQVCRRRRGGRLGWSWR